MARSKSKGWKKKRRRRKDKREGGEALGSNRSKVTR